jgi:hypothetical protein
MKKLYPVLLGVLLCLAPAHTLVAEESLLSVLLDFLGIAASPSQQKGLDDSFAGDIWIMPVVAPVPRPIAENDKYRSPVFYPDGARILALGDDRLVEIEIATGRRVLKPYQPSGIVKIVGFQKTDFDKVLVVFDDRLRGLRPGILSLESGIVTPVTYDPKSHDNLVAFSNLKQWDRTYDDVELYVLEQTKPGFGGPRIWTDVFLKRGANPPRNLTNCNGISCGQPSLSFDGQQVVYIKSMNR